MYRPIGSLIRRIPLNLRRSPSLGMDLAPLFPSSSEVSVARLFGIPVPHWPTQARHIPSPARRWQLSTEEHRATRLAYDDAILRFAEASAVLYRRAADGATATPEELRAYAEAQSRLEVARATYNQSLWHPL
jgi:hypothetical protein